MIKMKLLSKAEYKATLFPKMVNVTECADEIVDLWAYVDPIIENEYHNFSAWKWHVKNIYESPNGEFQHICIPVPVDNTYLVVVVNKTKLDIMGHYILSLEAEYSVSKTNFEFKCTLCGDIHEGIPTFGADYPISVLNVPEGERAKRVDLGSDDCVIDGKEFYVRGCIEIPVQGYDDPFVWGSWVSLSENSFLEFIKYFEKNERSHIGPFFGWHCGDFKVYDESCISLKTQIHLRDNGIRPLIELEPSHHQLAVEQRDGISRERLIEIYEIMVHGSE